MKSKRPYVYKKSLNDPFPIYGETGAVLQLSGFQTHDDWVVVRSVDEEAHKANDLYINRHSFKSDFDYEIEKSPWLDERTLKAIRKNRANAIKLLNSVREAFSNKVVKEKKYGGHMYLAWVPEIQKSLAFSKAVVYFANKQADIDSVIETMQATCNTCVTNIDTYATHKQINAAIERAINWLNSLGENYQ